MKNAVHGGGEASHLSQAKRGANDGAPSEDRTQADCFKVSIENVDSSKGGDAAGEANSAQELWAKVQLFRVEVEHGAVRTRSALPYKQEESWVEDGGLSHCFP